MQLCLALSADEAQNMTGLQACCCPCWPRMGGRRCWCSCI